MNCLPLPLAWSILPPISVERSPPSLPASSLTLPLLSSHLPSSLSFVESFMKLFPPNIGLLAHGEWRQERCQPRLATDFLTERVTATGARVPYSSHGHR